jgi:hypothetical protein
MELSVQFQLPVTLPLGNEPAVLQEWDVALSTEQPCGGYKNLCACRKSNTGSSVYFHNIFYYKLQVQYCREQRS